VSVPCDVQLLLAVPQTSLGIVGVLFVRFPLMTNTLIFVHSLYGIAPYICIARLSLAAAYRTYEALLSAQATLLLLLKPLGNYHPEGGSKIRKYGKCWVLLLLLLLLQCVLAAA